MLSGFGHTIKAGEDGTEGFVETGIVRVTSEGYLEHRGGFFVAAAPDEKGGKLACYFGGFGTGVETVAQNFKSLAGLASAFVSCG
jgi:hypothetical protein